MASLQWMPYNSQNLEPSSHFRDSVRCFSPAQAQTRARTIEVVVYSLTSLLKPNPSLIFVFCLRFLFHFVFSLLPVIFCSNLSVWSNPFAFSSLILTFVLLIHHSLVHQTPPGLNTSVVLSSWTNTHFFFVCCFPLAQNLPIFLLVNLLLFWLWQLYHSFEVFQSYSSFLLSVQTESLTGESLFLSLVSSVSPLLTYS